MIRISVIVPFYNSERYIKRCIEGLLQQSYPREQYEILMIDNNSTDTSAETVRQYPGIQLLHETMQGSYAARNRGLREAKGGVMAFIDADCVPSHDWLHEIMLAMEKPDLSIVLGRRAFAGDSILLSMFAAYEDEKHKYVFNSDKQEIYYGHTNNMAAKKKNLMNSVLSWNGYGGAIRSLFDTLSIHIPVRSFDIVREFKSGIWKLRIYVNCSENFPYTGVTTLALDMSCVKKR